MSRIASVLIAFCLLASIAAAQENSQPVSAPQPTSASLTVFLVNDNVDRSIFDKVTASVQEWGAWKVVSKREDADLLLVLSEKVERSSYAFNPMPLFELNVYYCAWQPIIDVDTLTLSAIKRSTDRQLVSVSCARHRIPSAPKWLVSRLRKKMDKLEKSGS